MTMKLCVAAVMGFALLPLVLVSCKEEKEEPTPPKYHIQAIATEGGTVEGQSGEYEIGEALMFTAIPSEGYYFDQWSDGNIREDYYLKVTQDLTITAQFKKKTITTVDLGLKSGTLWATCNLGAYRPWEKGDYYAWGETEPKEKYSGSNYKYWTCEEVEPSTYDLYKLTKYSSDEKYGENGLADMLTTLQPDDDAATAVWGAEYSTPTYDDWIELVNQCYLVYARTYVGSSSGVIVYKAKSESDRGAKGPDGIVIDNPSASYSLSDPHIFIPFTTGDEGIYWSATLYPYPREACRFKINSHYNNDFSDTYCTIEVEDGFYHTYRCYGYSVRPVKHK